jgi:hypothetical protein
MHTSLKYLQSACIHHIIVYETFTIIMICTYVFLTTAKTSNKGQAPLSSNDNYS